MIQKKKTKLNLQNADILGHKYIETTENFYIKSTEENRKDVITAFDKVMTSDLINDVIKYEIAY